MFEDFFDYLVPAGIAALSLWNPAAGAAASSSAGGAAGAAAGAANGASSAGLLGNAFGSADMLAQAAPGFGLLNYGAAAAAPMTAVNDAGEAVTAFGPNGEYFGKAITDGGMTANPFTGGYDSKGFLERGMDQVGSIFDKMPRIGMPQQQQQNRPAAIIGQIKPVGRNAPQAEPISMPYGQPQVSGRQLTPEEEQIAMFRMMYGRG